MFFLGWQGVYAFIALCIIVCLIVWGFARAIE